MFHDLCWKDESYILFYLCTLIRIINTKWVCQVASFWNMKYVKLYIINSLRFPIRNSSHYWKSYLKIFCQNQTNELWAQNDISEMEKNKNKKYYHVNVIRLVTIFRDHFINIAFLCYFEKINRHSSRRKCVEHTRLYHGTQFSRYISDIFLWEAKYL